MALGNLEIVPNVDPESNGDSGVRVGRLLMEARQELKLTIAQVSADIRIRQIYLEYLESGNFRALPGQVYLVGFLKTYASYLKLDYLELLRQLNLHSEVICDYSSFTYVIPARAQQSPSRKLSFITASLAVILLAAIYYLGQQEGGVETTPPQLIDDKPLATREIVEEKELAVFPAVNSIAPVVDNGVVVPGEVTNVAPTTVPVVTSHPVRIKAIRDSWVQVLNKEGKTIYVRLMHSGDVYTLPESNCTLNTGNAGGLKILLGDQESAVLGEDGKVIRGLRLNDEALLECFKGSLKAAH